MFGIKDTRFSKPLGLRLLSITLPQSEKDGERPDISAEINRSEQLFTALFSLGEPFIFEVAVHNIGGEINFYLAIPLSKVDFATHQILALFPEAEVTEAHDYTIFGPGSKVAGGTLFLGEKPLLPIRTYEDAGVDTFALILSSLSKLSEVGDGAAIQLIVQPASASYHAAVQKAIERVRHGERLGTILDENGLTEVAKFGAALFGTSKKKEERPEMMHRPQEFDETAVAALTKKIEKQLFEVEVRILVATEDADRSRDLLLDIAGTFAQFNGPMRNSIKLERASSASSLVYDYSFRTGGKLKMILNSEELASIFHLPGKTTDIPRINWHSAKSVDTPIELPTEGIIIGDSSFRGEVKQVRITDEDRRRHVYIVGQTGTGKSTLIRSMISQDISAGKGVCLIDPSGDLVDDVLGAIPLHRIDDVIVLDPSELGRPLGLNMLEYDLAHPEQKTFIVGEMQSIFNRLFDQATMGPIFEQYMRNALLLLMEDAATEPATLVEVPRVFTDSAWRNAKLDRIKNPIVIDFWRKEAEKAGGEGSLANMTPYITSKFGNFIGNDYIRPIIGQQHSSFDFRKVMDEGKILLVKLSKGRIGDINANLLGMIITGKLLMAALSRDDIAPEARRDFYLYIDEFQNFTTDSIATILSEARKYKLDLTIAHQFIAQLPTSIKEAVFGNAGTLISFRIGSEDAEVLAKHMAPNFTSTDLIGIENLRAVIRPLINGQPARAFNMKIRFSEKGSPEVAAKLMELSRLTYGASLAQVEDGILARLRD
jgi:hypothetical protein